MDEYLLCVASRSATGLSSDRPDAQRLVAWVAFLLMIPLLVFSGGCTGRPSFGDEGTLAVTTGLVNATGRQVLEQLDSPSSVDLTVTRVDASRLLSIEERTLPQALTEGPHQYTTLPEYYWGANPRLVARLQRARTAFDCVPPPTFHALTLVTGTAGIGKTFIKSSVFSKEHPSSALCKFDLRELYESWASKGIVVDVPDLQDAGVVLNTLPSVSDKSRPWIREYLDSSEASFFVIDSLDEVHPDDYAWILGQVRDFVSDPARHFVHVVVFSRPFAVRDFWQAASMQQNNEDMKLFALRPPELRTTGDLKVSSWNYQCWKNKLSWQADGGKLESMPLDAYIQWANQGFATTGPFASVTSTDDASRIPAADSMLTAWATEYPAVGSVLRNLAGNSMVREIVEHKVDAGLRYDERSVKEAYLHAWLSRETRTDSRPSLDNPEYLELYIKLLEQVAATTVHRGEVDTWGYFPLHDGQRALVHHEGRTYAFPIVRVVNHSGLIDVECRGAGVTKCRFEPIWVHRLLAEMHNDRVAAGSTDFRLISQSGD